MNVPPAPVYRPSRLGICKIIPPDDWKPPNSFDTKKLRFNTRRQRIDLLQWRDLDQSKVEFFTNLVVFWQNERRRRREAFILRAQQRSTGQHSTATVETSDSMKDEDSLSPPAPSSRPSGKRRSENELLGDPRRRPNRSSRAHSTAASSSSSSSFDDREGYASALVQEAKTTAHKQVTKTVESSGKPTFRTTRARARETSSALREEKEQNESDHLPTPPPPPLPRSSPYPPSLSQRSFADAFPGDDNNFTLDGVVLEDGELVTPVLLLRPNATTPTAATATAASSSPSSSSRSDAAVEWDVDLYLLFEFVSKKFGPYDTMSKRAWADLLRTLKAASTIMEWQSQFQTNEEDPKQPHPLPQPHTAQVQGASKRAQAQAHSKQEVELTGTALHQAAEELKGIYRTYLLPYEKYVSRHKQQEKQRRKQAEQEGVFERGVEAGQLPLSQISMDEIRKWPQLAQRRAEAAAHAHSQAGESQAAASAAASSSSSSSSSAAAAVKTENGVKSEETGSDGFSACVQCKLDLLGPTSQCYHCHSSYHWSCLTPPLVVAPLLPWLCPDCVSGGNFGFEEGNQYDFATYETVASQFKHSWFARHKPQYTNDKCPYHAVHVAQTQAAKKGASSSSSSSSSPSFSSPLPSKPPTGPCICPIPHSALVSQYWSIVEGGRHASNPVTVEYGSDLDTAEAGSGFPSSGNYARSGWNLNNLPQLSRSLLKHLTNISGVTIPWLYVGMLFSSFCWHAEDHYCYSINYVHQGSAKQWYGIPAHAATAFETLARRALPHLFHKQPDVLFQMVTQISPQVLMQAGIPVYSIQQNPGEFVLTFPQAYHGGFNCGVNLAEAVNFAPADWLPFGIRSVERYRSFQRTPVFSTDELLLQLAQDPLLNEYTASWLLPCLQHAFSEESVLREHLRSMGVVQATRWTHPLHLDLFGEEVEGAAGEEGAQAAPFKQPRKAKSSKYDKRKVAATKQCVRCKHAVYMSAVWCECSPKQVACLRHASYLCRCPPSKQTLLQRFDLSELSLLLHRVHARMRAQGHEPFRKMELHDEEPVERLVDIQRECEEDLADPEIPKFQTREQREREQKEREEEKKKGKKKMEEEEEEGKEGSEEEEEEADEEPPPYAQAPGPPSKQKKRAKADSRTSSPIKVDKEEKEDKKEEEEEEEEEVTSFSAKHAPVRTQGLHKTYFFLQQSEEAHAKVKEDTSWLSVGVAAALSAPASSSSSSSTLPSAAVSSTVANTLEHINSTLYPLPAVVPPLLRPIIRASVDETILQQREREAAEWLHRLTPVLECFLHMKKEHQRTRRRADRKARAEAEGAAAAMLSESNSSSEEEAEDASEDPLSIPLNFNGTVRRSAYGEDVMFAYPELLRAEQEGEARMDRVLVRLMAREHGLHGLKPTAKRGRPPKKSPPADRKLTISELDEAWSQGRRLSWLESTRSREVNIVLHKLSQWRLLVKKFKLMAAAAHWQTQQQKTHKREEENKQVEVKQEGREQEGQGESKEHAPPPRSAVPPKEELRVVRRIIQTVAYVPVDFTPNKQQQSSTPQHSPATSPSKKKYKTAATDATGEGADTSGSAAPSSSSSPASSSSSSSSLSPCLDLSGSLTLFNSRLSECELVEREIDRALRSENCAHLSLQQRINHPALLSFDQLCMLQERANALPLTFPHIHKLALHISRASMWLRRAGAVLDMHPLPIQVSVEQSLQFSPTYRPWQSSSFLGLQPDPTLPASSPSDSSLIASSHTVVRDRDEIYTVGNLEQTQKVHTKLIPMALKHPLYQLLDDKLAKVHSLTERVKRLLFRSPTHRIRSDKEAFKKGEIPSDEDMQPIKLEELKEILQELKQGDMQPKESRRVERVIQAAGQWGVYVRQGLHTILQQVQANKEAHSRASTPSSPALALLANCAPSPSTPALPAAAKSTPVLLDPEVLTDLSDEYAGLNIVGLPEHTLFTLLPSLLTFFSTFQQRLLAPLRTSYPSNYYDFKHFLPMEWLAQLDRAFEAHRVLPREWKETPWREVLKEELERERQEEEEKKKQAVDKAKGTSSNKSSAAHPAASLMDVDEPNKDKSSNDASSKPTLTPAKRPAPSSPAAAVNKKVKGSPSDSPAGKHEKATEEDKEEEEEGEEKKAASDADVDELSTPLIRTRRSVRMSKSPANSKENTPRKQAQQEQEDVHMEAAEEEKSKARKSPRKKSHKHISSSSLLPSAPSTPSLAPLPFSGPPRPVKVTLHQLVSLLELGQDVTEKLRQMEMEYESAAEAVASGDVPSMSHLLHTCHTLLQGELLQLDQFFTLVSRIECHLTHLARTKQCIDTQLQPPLPEDAPVEQREKRQQELQSARHYLSMRAHPSGPRPPECVSCFHHPPPLVCPFYTISEVEKLYVLVKLLDNSLGITMRQCQPLKEVYHHAYNFQLAAKRFSKGLFLQPDMLIKPGEEQFEKELERLTKSLKDLLRLRSFEKFEKEWRNQTNAYDFRTPPDSDPLLSAYWQHLSTSLPTLPQYHLNLSAWINLLNAESYPLDDVAVNPPNPLAVSTPDRPHHTLGVHVFNHPHYGVLQRKWELLHHWGGRAGQCINELRVQYELCSSRARTHIAGDPVSAFKDSGQAWLAQDIIDEAYRHGFLSPLLNKLEQALWGLQVYEAMRNRHSYTKMFKLYTTQQFYRAREAQQKHKQKQEEKSTEAGADVPASASVSTSSSLPPSSGAPSLSMWLSGAPGLDEFDLFPWFSAFESCVERARAWKKEAREYIQQMEDYAKQLEVSAAEAKEKASTVIHPDMPLPTVSYHTLLSFSQRTCSCLTANTCPELKRILDQLDACALWRKRIQGWLEKGKKKKTSEKKDKQGAQVAYASPSKKTHKATHPAPAAPAAGPAAVPSYPVPTAPPSVAAAYAYPSPFPSPFGPQSMYYPPPHPYAAYYPPHPMYMMPPPGMPPHIPAPTTTAQPAASSAASAASKPSPSSTSTPPSSPDARISISSLVRLIRGGCHTLLLSDELSTLHRFLLLNQEWVNKLDALFQPRHPKLTLRSLLKSLLVPITAEEDREKLKKIADGLEGGAGGAAAAGDKKANKARQPMPDCNGLYCICKRPYDRQFMIACDHCDQWYHGECVNLSLRAAEQLRVYLCPKCSDKKGQPYEFGEVLYRHARPTIVQCHSLLSWLESELSACGATSLLICDHVRSLRTVLQRIDEFNAYCMPWLLQAANNNAGAGGEEKEGGATPESVRGSSSPLSLSPLDLSRLKGCIRQGKKMGINHPSLISLKKLYDMGRKKAKSGGQKTDNRQQAHNTTEGKTEGTAAAATATAATPASASQPSPRQPSHPSSGPSNPILLD